MVVTNQESLQIAFKQFSDAIDCCVAKQLQTPALVLTYCTIDITSWLYSESKTVKTRFIDWVEKYLLPGSLLKCTALDLYGARCGIVHSNSPESDLSKDGKVKQVAYAWLRNRAPELEKLVGFGVRLGIEGFIAIQAEDLIASLHNGVNSFLRELSTDHLRAETAYAKAAKCFINLSAADAAEMRHQAEKVLGDFGQEDDH